MHGLALVSLCAVLGSAAHADLVVNGSFEDPPLDSYSDDGTGVYWYGFLGENGLTGWTHPAIVVGVDRDGGWESHHGQQYINIEQWRASFIEQDIPTTVGHTYTLSFAYAPDPYEAPGSTQSDIGVLWDGQLVATASGDDDTTGDLSWSVYTIRVTATQEVTRLRFEDRGFAGLTGGYLDAIMLEPCAADFNGDGSVNVLDVLAFLNAWAAGSAEADFNNDGNLDALDMLAFLNAWAAGCP